MYLVSYGLCMVVWASFFYELGAMRHFLFVVVSRALHSFDCYRIACTTEALPVLLLAVNINIDIFTAEYTCPIFCLNDVKVIYNVRVVHDVINNLNILSAYISTYIG